METRQDGASAAGPGDDQELAQFRKEQPIFDALMIELRGSWPQYEHYRTLLNEARGFREESQPSTAGRMTALQAMVRQNNHQEAIMLHLVGALNQIIEKGDQESRRIAEHALDPRNAPDAPADARPPASSQGMREAVEELARLQAIDTADIVSDYSRGFTVGKLAGLEMGLGAALSRSQEAPNREAGA